MKNKSETKLYWTAKLAIVTFITFLVGIIINFFRLELLGVVPGNAANNFSFNIGFFIPFNLLILLSCLVVIIGILIKWNKNPKIKNRLISLVFALPIVIFWTLQIIWVLSI